MASTNSNSLGYNGGRFYSFLNRPVLINCDFVVDSANGNGLGLRSLKGSGVQNVFMHTSASAGRGANNYLNPNPASGYALIQLMNNYNRYCGGFSGYVSPVTGGNLAINASALTAGVPYVIVSTGHAADGTVTVAPVADTAGSLASTWFSLFDSYGNTFIIWFSVSGVGAAPKGVSGTLVQQSISSGDTAATIGADLVLTIENLPSGIAGVFSFTASGTTTVTVVSTQANPHGPLPGAPQDGLIPTGFTFAQTVYKTNLQNWVNVGLPVGVVPAVGASFIATATGDSTGGGSTGLVKAVGVSGILGIEAIGDANKSLAPMPVGGSPNVGGWVLVQFIGATLVGTVLGTHTHNFTVIGGQIASTTNDIANYAGPLLGKQEAANATYLGANSATNGGVVAASAGTPAGTITLAATAPADGTVIGMSFYVEAGSIIIAGE